MDTRDQKVEGNDWEAREDCFDKVPSAGPLRSRSRPPYAVEKFRGRYRGDSIVSASILRDEAVEIQNSAFGVDQHA